MNPDPLAQDKTSVVFKFAKLMIYLRRHETDTETSRRQVEGAYDEGPTLVSGVRVGFPETVDVDGELKRNEDHLGCGVLREADGDSHGWMSWSKVLRTTGSHHGGPSKPGQGLCFGPKGCEEPLKGFEQRATLVTGWMYADGWARDTKQPGHSGAGIAQAVGGGAGIR